MRRGQSGAPTIDWQKTCARYNESSAAERVNSNLKDGYGGRSVRVPAKKSVRLAT